MGKGVAMKEDKKYYNGLTRIKIIIFLVLAVGVLIGGFLFSTKVLNQKRGANIAASVISDETQTYDEIYDKVKAIKKNIVQSEDGGALDMVSEGSKQGDGAVDFSDTNIQVDGVDEADIIKTDGRYIYVLENESENDEFERPADHYIRIIDTEKKMNEIAKVMISKEDQALTIEELYISDNTMVIIFTSISEPEYKGNIEIVTFDISNKLDVKETGRINQEGYLVTSRRAENIIYVISNYYPTEITKETCVPIVNSERIPADKVLLFDECDYPAYSTILSIDVKRPDEVLDVQAVLSGYGDVYMSKNNIYIEKVGNDIVEEQDEYEIHTSVTDIIRVACKNGQMEYKGIARVEGTLNNSFSIDEYDGYIRVVTTSTQYVYNKKWWGGVVLEDSISDKDSESTNNNLYIIDLDMQIVGTIEDVAKGESVQSARFLGDIGYFVTFKNVDPLFAVDLSDPASPKILSELKITGFSSYLHFWSENLLLGIGEEVDPVTSNPLGIKLSMFDISNPSDVKEVNKYVIEGELYADALYQHKAVLINRDKNLVGFSIRDNEMYSSGYYIFSYNKKGFEMKLCHDFGSEDYDNGWFELYDRGFYIEDCLYIVKQGVGISQYSLETFKLMDALGF